MLMRSMVNLKTALPVEWGLLDIFMVLEKIREKGVCRICGHDEKKDKFKSRDKMSDWRNDE